MANKNFKNYSDLCSPVSHATALVSTALASSVSDFGTSALNFGDIVL